MSDDLLQKKSDQASGDGKGRGDLTRLTAFQNSPGTDTTSTGGTPTDGPKKIGRPTKEEAAKKMASGVAPKKGGPPPLPPVFDMVSEQERKDFENLLAEILIATTEETAAYRFELLKRVHPEEIARAQADKALLSPLEKKYFSKLAIRLYQKYVSDNFNYTDEMMAGVLAIRYFLRNREPARMAKEISAHGKADPQRPGLRRDPEPDPRHNGHGEVNLRGADGASPPR